MEAKTELEFSMKRKHDEIEEGRRLKMQKIQEQEQEQREREERERIEREWEECERKRKEWEKKKQEELKRSLREWERENNNNNDYDDDIALDPRYTLEKVEQEKLKYWEQMERALHQLRRFEKIEAQIKKKQKEEVKKY